MNWISAGRSCLVAGLCLAATGLQTAGAQDAGHGLPDHVCGTDLSSAEAMEALRHFRTAREQGLLAVARKSTPSPNIGDRRTFRVSEDSWIEVEFELVDKEENLYYLWVSVFELGTGRITDTVIQDLRRALVESTPGSIINPDAGVMANNEAMLGPPPNYDGDGVTDVLMYDIDPNDNTPGSFVAGYVHSADINPNASPGSGNQADVLYLDSNQGIASGATASTAAHEYAHLIHFATGFDTDTFISEGIAEYLTVVNGLGRDSYSFLALPGELDTPLMNWRSGSSEVVRDYARAELFFRYIGEQFTPQTVSAIAANPFKSAPGLDSVLTASGSSLAQVMLDFHSANVMNDRGIDFRFGYGADVKRSGVKAAVNQTFSGTVASETPPFADGAKPALESGAVYYLDLNNVADVRLRFDAAAAPILLPSARRLVSARIFLQDELGDYSYRDLAPGEAEYTFPGNYFRARLVFANVKPGNTVVSRYDYHATFTAFGSATATDDGPELPAAIALDQNYPNPFNPVTTISYELADAGPVRLVVYDRLGREVSRLVEGFAPAGSHQVVFDGSSLASGSYVYVLDAGGKRLSRQLTLLK